MYKNEEQIKEVLDIKSWRNLSKEKMLKFAAMMPDMDREVMFKIIEQFPEFRLFAKEVLDNMAKTYENTIDANKDNQKNLHNSFVETRRIFEEQLNKEECSNEMKMYLMDKIMECMDKEIENDTENKKFLSDMANKALVAAGTVILGAIVFVSGKVLLGKDES